MILEVAITINFMVDIISTKLFKAKDKPTKKLTKQTSRFQFQNVALPVIRLPGFYNREVISLISINLKTKDNICQ